MSLPGETTFETPTTLCRLPDGWGVSHAAVRRSSWPKPSRVTLPDTSSVFASKAAARADAEDRAARVLLATDPDLRVVFLPRKGGAVAWIRLPGSALWTDAERVLPARLVVGRSHAGTFRLWWAPFDPRAEWASACRGAFVTESAARAVAVSSYGAGPVRVTRREDCLRADMLRLLGEALKTLQPPAWDGDEKLTHAYLEAEDAANAAGFAGAARLASHLTTLYRRGRNHSRVKAALRGRDLTTQRDFSLTDAALAREWARACAGMKPSFSSEALP